MSNILLFNNQLIILILSHALLKETFEKKVSYYHTYQKFDETQDLQITQIYQNQ
ncbi:hypothetical protein EHRUM4_08600 [Ehrlichia ruminantium]|uniref:Uncharacterized protein n=1 Tax=Ehrlichia ruminantium TaxID=779 RepID=A0A170QYJ7_EHRRU|nr:hypothetical protein EHRUM4_08600 [Ehrlichia ruminantium]GAT77606.1 hypothetical protein EHRUM2_08330 [Ehrlichia ruminantium]GAT78767.1 hypothetical protein EHRUM3_09970 [Ehrlichia ruminantium]